MSASHRRCHCWGPLGCLFGLFITGRGQHRTGRDVEPCDPVACVHALTVVTFPFSVSLFLSWLWLLSRPQCSDGGSRQCWPALCTLNVVIIGALCPPGSLSSRAGEEMQRAAGSHCWWAAVLVWWSLLSAPLSRERPAPTESSGKRSNP